MLTPAPLSALLGAALLPGPFAPPDAGPDAAGRAPLTAPRPATSAERTAAAVAAVRRLGATAMNPDVFPGPAGREPALWAVTLDDRWTGGAGGLRHLRAIAGLSTVHLTDDCPLPAAAHGRLIAGEYGDFSVERRSKAFFGVQFSPGGAGGCRLEGVVPGGPAARAGLRRGDVVVQFGDAPIDTASDLLDAIRRHGTVGEAVPVTVFGPRRRRRVVLSVTPDRWPDLPRNDAGPELPRVAPSPGDAGPAGSGDAEE